MRSEILHNLNVSCFGSLASLWLNRKTRAGSENEELRADVPALFFFFLLIILSLTSRRCAAAGHAPRRVFCYKRRLGRCGGGQRYLIVNMLRLAVAGTRKRLQSYRSYSDDLRLNFTSNNDKHDCDNQNNANPLSTLEYDVKWGKI
jgi:hypothetical protein